MKEALCRAPLLEIGGMKKNLLFLSAIYTGVEILFYFFGVNQCLIGESVLNSKRIL